MMLKLPDDLFLGNKSSFVAICLRTVAQSSVSRRQRGKNEGAVVPRVQKVRRLGQGML